MAPRNRSPRPNGRSDYGHRRLARDLALMIVGVGVLLTAYAVVMPALHVHDRGAVLLAALWLASMVGIALIVAHSWRRPINEADEWCARADRELDELEARRRSCQS